MFELRRSLAKELQRKRVRIEVLDENTVVFRGVPTNEAFFNKESTNLLIKKVGHGMPLLLFVDEDLAYSGTDAALTKALAAGPKQEGWRVLSSGDEPEDDLQAALEKGLAALGFQGREPELPPSPLGGAKTGDARLLATFGTDLSRLSRQEHVEPTVGRRGETEAVVSCLLCWGQARLPLVVGESGVGKSNLLYEAARLLRKSKPEFVLHLLDLPELLAGTLFDAEREKLLAALLKEATSSPSTAVAIERLECAVLEVSHGALLLTQALDNGARLIGTTLPQYLPRFQMPPLARRVHPIMMNECTPRQTVAILKVVSKQIASHHRLDIDDSFIALCVKAAHALPGHLPAKAIALLDEAASNAALLGARFVSPDDICAAASRYAGGERTAKGEPLE